MSHFTVLVIGDDYEGQLAPYIEQLEKNEEGVYDDRFHSFEEDTEYTDEYENGTMEIWRNVFKQDAPWFHRYDTDGMIDHILEGEAKATLLADDRTALAETSIDLRYLKSPTGRGSLFEDREVRESREAQIPAAVQVYGYTLMEVTPSAIYDCLYSFMKEYHGMEPQDPADPNYVYQDGDEAIMDLKYGWWSNPNAKWDWYQVGGRWRGFFKVKEGVDDYAVGEAGVGDNAPKHQADHIRVGDVDFAGMQADASDEANALFDKVEKVAQEVPVRTETWEQTRERYGDGNIDAAREDYNTDPFVKALKEKVFDGFYWGDEIKDFYLHEEDSREKYVRSRVESCFTPYAFVKDGVWCQKGDMGWWGMSSNEKEQSEWNREFSKMLMELPDDTILTLVDCHI